MTEPNSPQASSSRGWWRTWKWAVYTWMCYAFHVILIIIHVVLLALHKFRREQNVVVPSNISNNVASVGVTTILQVFGTGYGILLVWLTQRLALRRDLLQRQTLTATHDKTGAWSGLGAALSTLLDQFKLKAATCGVLLVMLYLGGIAVLHVTSCSLMSLVPFDNTHVANAPTQYGMLNLADLPLDTYWNTATALIRSISGYPGLLNTTGLRGATLYETLPARSGYGNATVAAVTFGAQCYSLTNVSATLNSGLNGSYTVSAADGDQPPVTYSPIYSLYENVTYEVYANGRAVTILATPPILDANNNAGSTFNITQTRPTAGGVNETETTTIQIMTCVLSLTHQSAIINASTNDLLSIDPVSPLNSTWTPWQLNSTENPDPELDWFGDAWSSSAISTDFYGPTHCGEQGCLLSFLDEYLMALLGWQYNVTALNQSSVLSSSNNTLSYFESSMAQVASAAAWAVLTTSGYYTNSTGDTSVVQSEFKLRLNINLTPVSIGLFTSIALLALSLFLIHSPRVGKEHDVDSCGILQVIWLSGHHDAIQKEVTKANSSSAELRRAGLGCTTAFGAEDEVRPAESSNTPEGKC
ncbi:hypothetical protein BKA82DRAFT_4221299 [Pisolithus tinctorius]|nr:hypothetical protein BKA82DRAFT_4221299 [Pisolithus tinctorius]